MSLFISLSAETGREIFDANKKNVFNKTTLRRKLGWFSSIQ